MTLEAFGTVLSLKHRTHFTQCAEFKFTWFSLKRVFTSLRGQQTRVITMKRERLSQLQWDNPPPNTCTTARWSIPACDPNGQHDRERVPTQLISKPAPLKLISAARFQDW